MANEWIGIAGDALLAGAKGAAAGSVVPGLGTAVGGIIGLASSLVPHIFGEDAAPALAAAAQAVTGQSDEAGQMAVLSSNPEAVYAFKEKVLEIARQSKADDQTAMIEAAKASAADTADARHQTLALATAGSPLAWGAPVVSVIVTGGFFAIMTMLIIRPVTMDGLQLQLLNVMAGVLGTCFTGVVNYYIGSSLGSARKTELLSQSTPMSLLPKPAAIVPEADVPK